VEPHLGNDCGKVRHKSPGSPRAGLDVGWVRGGTLPFSTRAQGHPNLEKGRFQRGFSPPEACICPHVHTPYYDYVLLFNREIGSGIR